MSILDDVDFGDDSVLPARSQMLARALAARYPTAQVAPYQQTLARALASRNAGITLSAPANAATLSDNPDKQTIPLGLTNSPMNASYGLSPSGSRAIDALDGWNSPLPTGHRVPSTVLGEWTKPPPPGTEFDFERQATTPLDFAAMAQHAQALDARALADPTQPSAPNPSGTAWTTPAAQSGLLGPVDLASLDRRTNARAFAADRQYQVANDLGPVTVTPAMRESLGAVPGYPESGSYSWRGANDLAIQGAASRYNSANGYAPGDPGYVSPELMKAWEMRESGGSRRAFRTDPFQVNNVGDWAESKADIGLSPYASLTPDMSADKALEWLESKGHLFNRRGEPGAYIGDSRALARYNGNNRIQPDGHVFSQDYASDILSRYQAMKKQEGS